jgi:hypothetical protein
MLLVTLASLSALAAPSLKDAEAMLRENRFDELLAEFKSLRAAEHPEGDAKVAAFLVRSAQAALKKRIPTLAFDLSDKAAQLDANNVDAYLVASDAALAMGDVNLARQALVVAQSVAPKSAEIQRRLDRLDGGGAKSPAADTLEPVAPPSPPKGGAKTRTTDAEAGVAGMAARASDHFKVIYSEGGRDFAQKAQYEQRALDFFERAYQRVTRKLGYAPKDPTEVVLYTQQEFALHFGGSFSNGVLGFYAGKIRMNRSENLDDGYFDTAVHEYTHAVIDSIAHGDSHGIPHWLHEGLAHWVEHRTKNADLYNLGERLELKQMAKSKALPSLSQLDQTGFGSLGRGAWVAYVKSAVAVDLLLERGSGMVGLKRVIEKTGSGTPFKTAFAAEFGERTLTAIDEDANAVLAK